MGELIFSIIESGSGSRPHRTNARCMARLFHQVLFFFQVLYLFQGLKYQSEFFFLNARGAINAFHFRLVPLIATTRPPFFVGSIFSSIKYIFIEI